MPTSCGTPKPIAASSFSVKDNFSNAQIVRKSVVATRGGVVAAQHRRAAEAGAAVLEAGGDAIDAAIAPSFALGRVQPPMSGSPPAGRLVVCAAVRAEADGNAYCLCAPPR